jgi:hypothetical protein
MQEVAGQQGTLTIQYWRFRKGASHMVQFTAGIGLGCMGIRVRAIKNSPHCHKKVTCLFVQVKTKPRDRCTLCFHSWTVSTDMNNYTVLLVC